MPTRIATREVQAREFVLVEADIHVHLVAAVPNALTVENFSLEEDIYNFERLLVDRLQPKDGIIPLRDGPGVGLELDRAALERFRIG